MSFLKAIGRSILAVFDRERRGEGQLFSRFVPLVVGLFFLVGIYNINVYRGLDDLQSMDNAQLARQIVRHQGYTTQFLRPQAVEQLRDFTSGQSAGSELFPANRFPPGTPRVLPDTYNAPGYPCLLAAWFWVLRPNFNEAPDVMSARRIYAGDRWIPPLNQIFVVLTAVLVYVLARRLFDERVAWISTIGFLCTDLVWQFSITGLSTSFLMFLVTAMLMCALEIFCISEACFINDNRSFTPAWAWSFALVLLLGVACLTRLHLLVFLVPLFALFLIMPRGSFFMAAITTLMVAAMVTPWFVREALVSGNPLGSNLPIFLKSDSQYSGNQIFCSASIPSYLPILHSSGEKEVEGLLWHLDHGWALLGSSPLVLFFFASILHIFKRRRTRMFHYLLFGSGLVLIAANSLGSAQPDDVGAWNIIVLLLPCVTVMGTAYFFVLLDRISLQIRFLRGLIVGVTLFISALPMIITVTKPNSFIYAFPPYMPPLIKSYGQFAQPDEWITTDMPWATAWYADRASLWLPDSMADFQNFNANLCPTGVLLLTPVSGAEPVTTFTSGEYKDWLTFISGQEVPASFPLASHTRTAPGGPDYSLWSDRPRWQER